MPNPTHSHLAAAAARTQSGVPGPVLGAVWATDVLRSLGGTLGIALARWADRDDAADKGAARSAANTACDAIDGMLAALHAARLQLVDEIRAHDDATAARVDALLTARCVVAR